MIHRRQTPQVLVACLLLILVGSCTSQPLESIPGSSAPDAIAEPTGSDGQSYTLHLPPATPPTGGWPLVIALHGISSNAREMDALTGFNSVADREGFAVAYPDAGDGLWLDLSDGLFGDSGVASESDVEFIEEMIDTLVADHGINPNEVYVSGFSNGALFAIQLACELPEQFAAVGVVAAAGTASTLGACALDHPVAYIAFHGTTDSVVPFDGGDLIDGIPGIVEFSSAEETIVFWSEQLDCAAEPAHQRLQTDPDFPITQTTFTACDSATAVELYAIEGGGHGWPGGNNEASATATTSAAIDASQIMWDFFVRYGR